MHLPLDIYTLIGRNVAILLPLARLYDKRMMLVGDQRYTGASRNAIRFTSYAQQGKGSRYEAGVFIFHRDSLRYRFGYVTQILTSSRLPFSTGNRAGEGAIFRSSRCG